MKEEEEGVIQSVCTHAHFEDDEAALVVYFYQTIRAHLRSVTRIIRVSPEDSKESLYFF